MFKTMIVQDESLTEMWIWKSATQRPKHNSRCVDKQDPCSAFPARFSHFKRETDDELHECVESYVLKTNMHKLVGEEPPHLFSSIRFVDEEGTVRSNGVKLEGGENIAVIHKEPNLQGR